MKTAAQIINEVMSHENGKLKQSLELYDLSINDIGVYIYDEDKQTLQNINDDKSESFPLQIWYEIKKNKIHSLITNYTHEKIENHTRTKRLEKIGIDS